MNDDDKTLGRLIRFSRYSLTKRRLCCPMCGGGVVLQGGRYHCDGEGTIPPMYCGVWDSLADLAVGEGGRA